MRDWGVRPNNFRVDRARNRLKQAMRPSWVCRIALVLGPYSLPDHPVSGNETGCQSTGNSETDDAQCTSFDSCLQVGNELRGVATDDRYSRPQGDARLNQQRSNGNDSRRVRHWRRPRLSPDIICSRMKPGWQISHFGPQKLRQEGISTFADFWTATYRQPDRCRLPSIDVG